MFFRNQPAPSSSNTSVTRSTGAEPRPTVQPEAAAGAHNGTSSGRQFNVSTDIVFYDTNTQYAARRLFLIDWRPDAGATSHEPLPPPEGVRLVRQTFAPSHQQLQDRLLIVFVCQDRAVTSGSSNTRRSVSEDHERRLVRALDEVAVGTGAQVALFRGLVTGFERTVALFQKARVVRCEHVCFIARWPSTP